jgi:hypothetical protein
MGTRGIARGACDFGGVVRTARGTVLCSAKAVDRVVVDAVVVVVVAVVSAMVTVAFVPFAPSSSSL